MEPTWVLVANGSTARIYEMEREGVVRLAEILHPEGRAKVRDLTTDHGGSRQTRTDDQPDHRIRGSYPEPTDPKAYAIDRFALDLANRLDHERTQNRFRRLIICAPPGFHGMLNRHLSDEVTKLVSDHVEKDFTKVEDRELLERLRPHLHGE